MIKIAAGLGKPPENPVPWCDPVAFPRLTPHVRHLSTAGMKKSSLQLRTPKQSSPARQQKLLCLLANSSVSPPPVEHTSCETARSQNCR